MTAPKPTHPVWCGLGNAGCTVTLPVVDPYPAHRSRPVPLDLSTAIGLPREFQVGATVRVEQIEAAWETTEYLMVRLGEVEFSLPVDAVQALLAEVGKLVARTVPPVGPDNVMPAELASRNGSPASAEDDWCPACDWPHGTVWLGEDDHGQNHWAHVLGHPRAVEEGDSPPCGLRWTTRVRRPGNGVDIVMVFPASETEWETLCHFCRRNKSKVHPTKGDAEAYAAQHTADHEAEVGR